MKVFISWSGVASRMVAEALSEWLPKVIQGIEPFVSAKDLDKGSNWTVELARELNDTAFGIICLAPDNLLSPWLNYEAGAITKSVDSRVAPVLFGVAKEDVQPPMSQLQLTTTDIEEFESLMMSLNRAAGSRLREDQVKEAVSVWWPAFEKELQSIDLPEKIPSQTENKPSEPVKPQLDISEMLAEVLARIRKLDERLIDMEQKGLPPVIPRRRTLSEHEVFRIFIRYFEKIGIEMEDVTVRDGKIQVRISHSISEEDLPGLMEMGQMVAAKGESDIWFLMPGRTLTIDQNGRLDEIPF